VIILKPDDKGLKNSDSYVKPSIFTRIFESKRLLHDTPIFEPYDLIAGKLMPNTSYDVDSPLSKLAVVKRTLLRYLGPPAAVDELVYILASFTSIPENRNELDKYLEWLRYLEYLDDLMYIDN
jgi:hypothetical protein